MQNITTLTLQGNTATIVDVECHMSNGLPGLVIVGFGNRAVIEARERLRGAFISSKLALPPSRITVNLAPADIPKHGTAYDLAIAVAILNAQKLISPLLPRTMYFGELGLNGTLKPVRGLIGLLLSARHAGYRNFYVPLANLRQAQLVPGINILAGNSLRDVYMDLIGVKKLTEHAGGTSRPEVKHPRSAFDFSHIVGQHQAKRVMEITAVGHHNVLLNGPPGTGKSLLAKALPSIMPPLSEEEILQVSHLHSLTDAGFDKLVTSRPIRSPHHSISLGALLGGGNRPRPGEISLAHRGVLFLDELPEFHREATEALRQPLEDREITIARAHDSTTFPADFILVATSNPCPCGNFGTKKRCTCSAYDVLRYQLYISGPLMDRIDLYIEVENITHGELLTGSLEESSDLVAKRVAHARQIQLERGQQVDNASLSNEAIRQYAQLDPKTGRLLNQAATELQLSARAYMRLLKVSRSIADLENSRKVTFAHINEALGYRKREAA